MAGGDQDALRGRFGGTRRLCGGAAPVGDGARAGQRCRGACRGGCCWWWSAGGGVSRWWRERFERVEGGGEVGGPGPAAAGEAWRGGRGRRAGRRREGGGSEAAWARPGELAGEQERLGPGEQVVREQDELEPDAVVLEVAEGKLRRPVSLSLRMWSSTRARARWRRSSAAILVGLVGEDRLEAVAVWSVNDSWAPGCGRSRRTITREPSGQPARSSGGDLGDLAVGALAAVLVERRQPRRRRDLEDRLADRLGEVKADREADLRLAAPVEQLVGGAGGIDAQQELDLSMCSAGICSSAASATAIWSAAVFAPALPGRSSPPSASPVSSA